VAVSASDPSTLFAASWLGVYRSTDRGNHWSLVGDWTGVGYPKALAIDPAVPSTVYVGANYSGMFKTLDGGASWMAINSGLPANPQINVVVIDPSSRSSLYAAVHGVGIYRTTDGGDSWTAVATGWPKNDVRDLAVDPLAPGVVYAGTAAGIYRTADAGATWIPAGLAGRRINSIAIDPSTPSTVYAATNAWVYKSTDNGTNWALSSNGLRSLGLQTLAIDPRSPSHIYAGYANGGIFVSTDAGGTWTAFKPRLPRPFVRALVFDRSDEPILYTGTRGGVWSLSPADHDRPVGPPEGE